MKYLERRIDTHLSAWKNDPDRKPLLVRGARQVGKSWAVRHLGQSFRHYLEVNFERDSQAKDFFIGSLNVHEIGERLSAYYGVPVVPGETLLFLDEIQRCPEAIHSLWFFYEDWPELHVAAAGSLLEFALKKMESFGVGRIYSLFVYPMSFDEFLQASGNGVLLDIKRQATASSPLIGAFHEKLVELYRSYMLVGGMPEAVSRYAESGSYTRSSKAVSGIVQTYMDDFSKYAEKVDPLLLRRTLFSVAHQLSRKFMYSQVEGGYRSENVKYALSLLTDAGLVLPVYHTAANGIPLGAEINEKYVKYLLIDQGMLLNLLGIDDSTGMLVKDILVASGQDLVDKGNVSEMAAGLEMLKYMTPESRHTLYYWENIDRGGRSEVDYIFARGTDVVPFEVKSGVKGSMTSMYVLMAKKANIHYGIRCSLENFGRFEAPNGKEIRIHPLYALSNLFG